MAETRLPRTIGFRMSLDETLDIGEDTGTPISEDYKVPFAFTGTLGKVTIDLGGADAKVAAEVERQRQIARTAE